MNRDRAVKAIRRRLGRAGCDAAFRVAKEYAKAMGIDIDERLSTGLKIGDSPSAILRLAISGSRFFGDNMAIDEPKHGPYLWPRFEPEVTHHAP